MSKRIVAFKDCERCGETFTRRRYQAGRLESMSEFRKRRFCSATCRARAIGKERTVPFWDGVDKSGGPDACWPWTRAINASGYGSCWVDGKSETASRRAYELTNGKIPDGEGYHGNVVMHSCDNRRCCNPNHLSLGSQGDNNDDRDAKGRGWWQQPSARRTAGGQHL